MRARSRRAVASPRLRGQARVQLQATTWRKFRQRARGSHRSARSAGNRLDGTSVPRRTIRCQRWISRIRARKCVERNFGHGFKLVERPLKRARRSGRCDRGSVRALEGSDSRSPLTTILSGDRFGGRSGKSQSASPTARASAGFGPLAIRLHRVGKPGSGAAQMRLVAFANATSPPELS